MSQEILSGLFSQNTFHLIWFKGGVHKYSYILSYSGSPTDLKVLRRKTQDFKDVRVHQSIIRLNCIHISLLLNWSFPLLHLLRVHLCRHQLQTSLASSFELLGIHKHQLSFCLLVIPIFLKTYQQYCTEFVRYVWQLLSE